MFISLKNFNWSLFMCIEKVRSPKTFLLKGVGVYNGTKHILVEIMAGGMGLKSCAKLNGSLLTL